MEEIKQIGLNIWGLRGGHKSFCHSDNLDINVSEILRTWLDIRDILYVSDLTVRFYALEFTPKYKVYTLYRPENDTGGRSGAYVATTLYVPHGLKINRTLELLRQISDAYHNDHYDAFGNPNTNPDYVQNYLDLIMNFAGNMLKEHDLRSWEGSAQNGIPKILPFTRLSVVEEFFDRPYRKEFLISQEVMFWDVDCLQNQQSHGVTFLKKEIISSGALFETDGKNIAPQFEGGVIKNTPMGYAIKRFVREGVDITSNWQSCFFFDKTNIDIELSKPYHHPLTYKGSMSGIDSPFVKHGRDDYDFSPRISFQPRRYEVPVSVANVGNTAFALYFDNQRVDINGGRGIFAFDGSLASKTCKVSIKPDGVTDFKVTDLMMSKFFVVGSDEPDRSQPFIIENLKVFRFKFNIDCSGLLKMRWTSSAINFSTTNKMFDIVLTAEKNASDFVFEIDGYISEIKTTDNTTFDVTLTKQNYTVEIVVPETIRAYLRSDDIRLKAAGKTYKGYKASVPIATKSTDLYLEIDVDGKGHALKCDYDISRNGDDVTLHPKLALLHNSHDKSLSFSPKGITFEVPAKSTVPVPDYFVANLENHNDKFKIETEISNNGIRRIVISLKAAPMNETTNSGSENNTSGGGHSDSGTGYQVGYQGGGNYGRSTRKTNEVIVGSYWYRGEEVKLFDGETNYTKTSEGIYTVNIVGRECLLCFEKSKAVPDKQKKLDKDNKRNGFKIEVKGGKYYVEAIERGNSGNGNKGMPRWLLWGGIGLGALLIIGGIVWLLLGLKGQERYLKIKNVDGYVFEVKGYTPQKPDDNAPGDKTTTFCLNKKCKELVVMAKGTINFDTTLIVEKDWFTKDNQYTYTITFEDRIKKLIKKQQEEHRRMLEQNREYICAKFKQSLDSVWSLNCSLNWLDSLKMWNDSINIKVVKGVLKYDNQNYKWKQTIVERVTGKDWTQDNGDDWVNRMIVFQNGFFNNLNNKEIADFTSSKGNRFSEGWYYQKKSYFTNEQKTIIDKIKDDDSFSNIMTLIQNGDSHTKNDTLLRKINYKQIGKALVKKKKYEVKFVNNNTMETI